MRAVVTGGAGFIGSHLTERLLKDGHEVLVIDNFFSGRPENLAQVINHPRIIIRELDISEHSGLEDYFNGTDWVFHLAGLADIVPSIEDPNRYHQTNVDGTVQVLEAARAAGAKRFIYAASSSCYGLPDYFPTDELAPIRTMHPYALTKYLGEECVLHWNQVYGLPCISLRLFNVYGPRARTTGSYGAVFGVFLAQKLAGKPLTVVGDGSQTRDFTYVTDVAEAFLAAAHSDVEGQVFNVGSGNTYSINHLVELLGGETVNIPKRPGEPDCTFADTQSITKMLGWQPKVRFADGVDSLLEIIGLWKDAPVWDEKSISTATETWFRYLSPDSGKNTA